MVIWRNCSAILSLLIICCAFDLSRALADSTFEEQPWIEIETESTIIRYKSDGDLIRFHESVKYGPGNLNRTSTFSSLPPSEVREAVIQKTDAVFNRAQAILDMRKKIEKPFINLYPDSGALKGAFTIIYRAPCNVRAWYRFRNNTLYINVKDVHAGMLAHELAHAIIDHFFAVKPPSETAEILARYVDSHL
jgi:hypothetical protein